MIASRSAGVLPRSVCMIGASLVPGAVHGVAQRRHRARGRVAGAQRVGAVLLGAGDIVVDVLVHVAVIDGL